MTSTARLYENAQKAFSDWCTDHHIDQTPTHEQIAQYLETCIATRGASSASVHLSAVAELYRSNGQALDTKHPAIQAAMFKSRRKHKYTPSKAKADDKKIPAVKLSLTSPNYSGAKLQVVAHSYTGAKPTTRPGVSFEMLWPGQPKLPPTEDGMTRLGFGVVDRHQVRELHALLTDFLWHYADDSDIA